ncbi:hypothetical protein [Paraburkholderia tagetis]|uniref:Uncharacterized protein n=1 Tax=Paraburkholderia tagetis TaxID=2913261 RepID=A0A9X1RXL3_9BURK|nr:hypothetical protein [Paraburkholderia tagetis]MCG5076563.1 hypothetical protein [Paraburkholderia tagetis]
MCRASNVIASTAMDTRGREPVLLKAMRGAIQQRCRLSMSTKPARMPARKLLESNKFLGPHDGGRLQAKRSAPWPGTESDRRARRTVTLAGEVRRHFAK